MGVIWGILGLEFEKRERIWASNRGEIEVNSMVLDQNGCIEIYPLSVCPAGWNKSKHKLIITS